MTASSPFCGEHPAGTAKRCVPCMGARRTRDQLIGSVRGDGKRGIAGQAKGHVTAVDEVEPEGCRAVLGDVVEVRLDDRAVDVIGSTGGQFEDSAVVEDLRRHDVEPTETAAPAGRLSPLVGAAAYGYLVLVLVLALALAVVAFSFAPWGLLLLPVALAVVAVALLLRLMAEGLATIEEDGR